MRTRSESIKPKALSKTDILVQARQRLSIRDMTSLPAQLLLDKLFVLWEEQQAEVDERRESIDLGLSWSSTAQNIPAVFRNLKSGTGFDISVMMGSKALGRGSEHFFKFAAEM
jgi:hypothetical protein